MTNPLPQPSKPDALNRKPPVEDEHAPLEEQIRAWLAKDGRLPGYYGADAPAQRAEALEELALLVARLEFYSPDQPREENGRFGEGSGSTREVLRDIKGRIRVVNTTKGHRSFFRRTEREPVAKKPPKVPTYRMRGD